MWFVLNTDVSALCFLAVSSQVRATVSRHLDCYGIKQCRIASSWYLIGVRELCQFLPRAQTLYWYWVHVTRPTRWRHLMTQQPFPLIQLWWGWGTESCCGSRSVSMCFCNRDYAKCKRGRLFRLFFITLHFFLFFCLYEGHIQTFFSFILYSCKNMI